LKQERYFRRKQCHGIQIKLRILRRGEFSAESDTSGIDSKMHPE
jgi:hypothetical protein